MQVLILAGGRGVRLRPLTNDCPKPLLQLGDRPILTRIIDQVPCKLRKTVIVAPEVTEPFRHWQEELPTSWNVRLYVEPSCTAGQLGPVRALSTCIDELEIQDDLLILMGDSLLPFTFAEFFKEADGNAVRLAAYELPELSQASRFGVVGIGSGDVVEHFDEKPSQPRSRWIFTGCLYVPRRLLSSIPRAGCECPTNAGDLVAEYLRRGERIEVFRATGDWHDIGTLESYLQAHQSLLSEGRRQLLVAQGNRLRGAVYVHPTAQVAGSVLQDCVVLADARVVDAQLASCVVQPHAAIIGRAANRKLISKGFDLPFAGE